MRCSWKQLYENVNRCERCGLCRARNNPAIGEGDPNAMVMFVGEGPGQEEDRLGRPFVGPAGKLLDRMLAAISLPRESVYIANVVKCRPPGNRTPTPMETEACLPYLREQFALVRPRILVCLGAVAAKALYAPDVKITRDRGKWIQRKGVWILPTYHPAALLRDESKKPDAWTDFKSIRDNLVQLQQKDAQEAMEEEKPLSLPAK